MPAPSQTWALGISLLMPFFHLAPLSAEGFDCIAEECCALQRAEGLAACLIREALSGGGGGGVVGVLNACGLCCD